MQSKLSSMACDASIPGPSQRKADYNMWHMYERYWQPFGKLLTDMEKEGMLVNRCAAVVSCSVCVCHGPHSCVSLHLPLCVMGSSCRTPRHWLYKP